jgi:Sec23/Sec24 trunk domain/Sec23/Sec24 zinc finger
MSNEDHPTARYRSGNGALFSSTKCPPGPDLSSQCDLPFGVVWTPFAPPDPAVTDLQVHALDDEALPPVLCLACLSYLHLFAQIRESDGTWVCELCGSRNVAPPAASSESSGNSNSSGRFRNVCSPAVEYRQKMPASAGSRQASAPSALFPASSSSPTTMNEAAAAAAAGPHSTTLVIVMDENLPLADAQAVAAALQQHFASASASTQRRTRVGLVVFGRSITVYQLGLSSGIAVGDVYTSHRALDEARLRTRPYLLDVASNPLRSLMRCLSSVYGIVIQDSASSLSHTHDGAAENRDQPMSRLEMLKRRKEARILRQQQEQEQHPSSAVPTQSPWEQRKEQQKSARPAFRCVGEALQVAIDLATVDVDPSRTSRILLFTNGCPNYGDGSVVSSVAGTGGGSMLSQQPYPPRRTADVLDPLQLQRSVEFFRVLSRAGCEVGVAVDVFCCGALELALPAYHAIVEASSGYVLSSLSFADPQFVYNLQHVLQHTFVSGLHGTPLRDENWIDGCIVDVRTPRSVHRTTHHSCRTSGNRHVRSTSTFLPRLLL